MRTDTCSLSFDNRILYKYPPAHCFQVSGACWQRVAGALPFPGLLRWEAWAGATSEIAAGMDPKQTALFFPSP